MSSHRHFMRHSTVTVQLSNLGGLRVRNNGEQPLDQVDVEKSSWSVRDRASHVAWEQERKEEKPLPGSLTLISELGSVSLIRKPVGLTDSCPSQRALIMAFQVCSSSPPRPFPSLHSSSVFPLSSPLSRLSRRHMNVLTAPEGLILAADVSQVGIFSGTQTPLLLLAKWLQGLETKELRWALSLSTQATLHPLPASAFCNKPSPSLRMGLNWSSWMVTSGGSLKSLPF